jgi:carbonic anhydrase
VCGHYACGGVKAAMQPADMGILNPWLRNIRDVYRTHKDVLNALTDEPARYDKLVELTYNMILRVMEYIPMADKKAHVDEYTENIAILFNKEDYANVTDKLIDGKTIMEIIQMLATSKTKTYPGLSSKCIFKYMDMLEM